MTQFNSFDFTYKRHLTKEQADIAKRIWDYCGEDEERTSTIQYKKKTNDYTLVKYRHYNA